MTTARAHLADQLRESLPKRWKLIPQPDNFDAITEPVVMLVQTRIAPTPQAPLGAHNVEFEVGLIDPSQTPSLAESNLDDEIDVLLYALEAIPSLAWTDAERVTFGERYQGWKLKVTITTRKD